MKKTMTILKIVLSLMIVMALTACGVSSGMQPNIGHSPTGGGTILASAIYLTLEDAAELATDVVVARYVTQRPFGQSITEFEFAVEERILGSAADTIFVYVQHNVRTHMIDTDISFSESNISFSAATQYLLMLERIVSTQSAMHEEGFWIIGNHVINLDNPSMSTMYNEPISQHSTGMDFNSRRLSSDMIISYISDLTRNNTPSRTPIRSDDLEEIIEGSPYVLIVEVGEPWRLAQDIRQSDGVIPTDIFHTTVVGVLKGDMEVGDIVIMVFYADTVAQGERHIIAIEPVPGTYEYFHMFTTRGNHSLFSLSQLEEILSVLPYYVALDLQMESSTEVIAEEEELVSDSPSEEYLSDTTPGYEPDEVNVYINGDTTEEEEQ